MRGYLPPQNDDERSLQKRIVGLASLCEKTGTVKTTAFLNDREQELAEAAANKCGCGSFAFFGGYDGAERKQMCVYPQGEEPVYEIIPIEISVKGASQKLTHRDYLGALMALGIKRECIGDIILNDSGAVLFSSSKMSDFICEQLFEIGRCSASANICDVPASLESVQDEQIYTVNVPSLRLDAVLAAILKLSRSDASKLIASKSVMINHVEISSAHEQIYDDDIFTVRGKGKFKIIETQGRSKKGRIFVAYRQF